MEIETRDFGIIEIESEDIVTFPRAIPGFPEEKGFVLLPLDDDSPFIILQSVNTAELAFITIEPGSFIKDYEFEISDSVAEKLKIKENKDIFVLAIATIKDELENLTINLAAPIIINLKEKLAKQVILDQEEFPVKYQLFAEKKADKKKEMVK